MNVLALVSYPEAGASTRYRIGQFVAPLEAQGVHVTLAPMLDGAAFGRLYRPGGVPRKALDWLAAAGRRRAQVDSARSYDAVFVLREVWPLKAPALERTLFARTRRVVFDFDDAVFLPNVSEANRSLAFLKAPDKSAWIARHARALTPGNAFLADWSRTQAAPEARVFELPTVVDTDRFRPRPKASDGLVRLGWIGTHSTMPFLEAQAALLERLLARHPQLRLLVIGAKSARLAHPQVEFVPWTLDGEVDALARVDVGLAPLPDSDWSRGKCGLKLLQYQALAIPVVASPVGVHPVMVEDGVHGFLAADDAAWERALERLVGDGALRAELGQRGRARVEERYSVRAMTPRLLEALRYAAEAA